MSEGKALQGAHVLLVNSWFILRWAFLGKNILGCKETWRVQVNPVAAPLT